MLRALKSGCNLARALGQCRRGIAAVEWAMIASFLFLVILGGVDYAMVAHHKMQMANAVRAGVQYATVRKPVQQDTTGIEEAVSTAAPADESGTRVISVTFACRCPDGTPVDCSDPCPSGEREAHVSVLMQEDHDLLFGLPFVLGTMTLRSEASVRLN